MGRIPQELQQVFIASNKGANIETIKPTRQSFKVFKNLFGFRRAKPSKNNGPKWRGKSCQSSLDTASIHSSTVATFTCASKAECQPDSPSKSPQRHLENLLRERGYSVDKYIVLETGYFNRPTPLQLASHNTSLINFVKNQEEDKLRRLLGAGISPNACNIHGETLIHKAARLGFHRIVSIFIEKGAEVKICDAQGRTLLHDACWGARPSFQTFSLLVKIDPSLLFMTDCRGACPLQYVRKDHYAFWIDFLDRIIDDLFSPTKPACALPLCLSKVPHSCPIPDPINALPLELASMVACGRISVQEAKILMEDNDDESSSSSYFSDDDEDSISEDESFSSDDENKDEVDVQLIMDMSRIHKLCVVPV